MKATPRIPTHVASRALTPASPPFLPLLRSAGQGEKKYILRMATNEERLLLRAKVRRQALILSLYSPYVAPI